MAFNSTNPVTVGAATKKDHYDRAFDNTIALSTGYSAIASLAALDLIVGTGANQLGRVAAGLAKQGPRINAAGTAWEFASAFADQIGTTADGSTTSAGVVSFTDYTFAANELSTKDILMIVTDFTVATNSVPFLRIYDETTNNLIFPLHANVALAAGDRSKEVTFLWVDAQDQTSIRGISLQSGSTAFPAQGAWDASGVVYRGMQTMNHNYTASWRLTTRCNGVNAGGTLYYKAAVYRIKGS